MRPTRETVREPFGTMAKIKVVRLERTAKALEEAADVEPNPLRAFAMRHVADVNRLKALFMRRYTGAQISEAIASTKTFAASKRLGADFSDLIALAKREKAKR